MAAEAQHALQVREQSNFAQRLRRLFAPIEPWYDWSADATILRLNTVERDFTDESEGPACEFEIQWLGLHLGFKIGRTPPAIRPDLIAARKLLNAQKSTASRFETLRLEYVALMQVQHERAARSRDWEIERIMVTEPSQSVADASAKLRFIVDADRLGIVLDGEEAAQIATDAALYLAPEA